MSNIPVPDLSDMPLGADPTAAEQIEYFTLNVKSIEAFAASMPFKRQRLVVKKIVDGNNLAGLRRDALKFLSQMVGRAQFGGKLNRAKPVEVTTRGRKGSSSASTALIPSPPKGSSGPRPLVEQQLAAKMPSRDLIGDVHQLQQSSIGSTDAIDARRPEITSLIKDQGFTPSLSGLLFDYRNNADRHSLHTRLMRIETEWRRIALMPNDIRAVLEWIEGAT